MEAVFHTSLVVLSILYTVLVTAYARIFARGAEGVAVLARPILLGTVGLHFLSIALRAAMVRSCPLGSQGEFLSLVAFSIGVIYAILEVRIGERTTGVFAILPAFLLQVLSTVLILGQGSPPDTKLGIYRSIHSFSAIVASSAVAVCGVYGLLYLFLYGAIKGGRFGLFFKKMPSLERLSDMNFVATCVAFLGLSVTIAIGFWSHASADEKSINLWRFEVLLTAFLWAVYGGSIVARRFFGLGGKRLAYTTVLGSILLVALIFGDLYTRGFHQ